MRVKPRILVVSHAASRNGATILLLHLLQWLRTHTEYELEVLMSGRGELLPEFQAVCKTMVWHDPAVMLEVLPRRLKKAWQTDLGPECLRWRMAGCHYDLVYFNTSSVAAYVPVLAKCAERVLWHIHELEYVLRLTIREDRIKSLFALATRFVTVSESVRHTLVQEFRVAPERLDVVHGFVPLPKLTSEEALSRRLLIRRQLGWPEDACVVGGCGAPGWRKGTDIFLQIARQTSNISGNEGVRFLWVGGGNAGEDEALRFDHDVRGLGLAGRCRIVPNTADVTDYYCAMDVFALSSREDPFPLVMLEAAACSLPMVCFDGAGGGTEFVGEDAGLVAPYLDVAAFAAHIDALHKSPELRRQHGAAAARKVQTCHVVETQGPKMLASIKHCLSGTP